MLHIIGLILKIIGIILVSILSLLVLVLCILLFVPIRYHIEGSYDNYIETLNVKVKISWFLHLVAGSVTYENLNLKWKMRELWFKQSSQGDVHQSDLDSEANYLKAPSQNAQEVPAPESQEETKPESQEASGLESQKVPESERKLIQGQKEESQKNTKSKKTIGQKLSDLKDKILEIIGKIKYTFKRFCDNIKLMLQKKEHIQDFLTDELHVYTLNKCKNELLYLLKHWKPRKCVVHGEVGFDDPYTTGRLLAGLSIAYPFIGEHMYITPNFETQVLRGDFYIKGKVTMVQVVIVGIRLLMDAKVRRTIRDVKNFKL